MDNPTSDQIRLGSQPIPCHPAGSPKLAAENTALSKVKCMHVCRNCGYRGVYKYKTLKDHSSCLLLPLNINIPPEQDAPQRQGHEEHARQQHAPLHESVCRDDGFPCGTAHWKLQLYLQGAVDLAPVALLLRGEILKEFAGHEVRPYRAGDRLPDGAADACEKAFEGKDHGDFVVWDRGHRG